MEEFFGDGWLLLAILGVTDAGNGGPWEWRPLGIADRSRWNGSWIWWKCCIAQIEVGFPTVITANRLNFSRVIIGLGPFTVSLPNPLKPARHRSACVHVKSPFHINQGRPNSIDWINNMKLSFGYLTQRPMRGKWMSQRERLRRRWFCTTNA